MKSRPIKKVLQTLNKLGGDTQRVDSLVSYWRTTFRTATGGDYNFATNIYEDGGANISARRAGAEQDEYFWDRSYETAAYGDSERLLTTLASDVRKLLQSPTRIVQSKSFLHYSFQCEILTEDQWRLISKQEAFRFGGQRFPPTKRKVTEYASPPLISSNEMQPDKSPESDA